MSNRLLLVSSHFPPDRSAGTHRVLRFANYLQGQGWPTAVLTLDPAFYRRSIPRDNALIDRVDPRLAIHRTRAFRGIAALVGLRDRVTGRGAGPGLNTGQSHPGTLTRWKAWRRRLVGGLFAFPDDEIGWFGSAVARGFRVVRRDRIEVVLTTAPPFTVHLIGYALKILCDVRWVADFRDPWSRAPWGKHGSARAHKWLEAGVVKRADAVVLNTPELLREFTEWYGPALARKFHVVANGYDADVLERFAKASPLPAPPLILTHAGNLYGGRDPMPLLEGLAQCFRKGMVPQAGIRLNLVGKIAPQFDVEGAIARLGLSGVVARTPPVIHDESLKILAASHVLVVIQPGTALQVPAKLYEYVGLRRAILALADEGGVARIVRDSGLGVVVSPTDESRIAEALALLYRRHTTAPDMIPDEMSASRFDAREQSAILGGIVACQAVQR